jgi:hypothetical protein
VFGNYSFGCLSDCVGYPGDKAFVQDRDATCYFLVDAYSLCTSYSVAYGLCGPPACASDCSARDWCYFGAGMAVGCPFADAWLGLLPPAQEIAQQCESSTAALGAPADDDAVAGTPEGGGEAASPLSGTAEAAIICTYCCIVLFLLFVFIYVFVCVEKRHILHFTLYIVFYSRSLFFLLTNWWLC